MSTRIVKQSFIKGYLQGFKAGKTALKEYNPLYAIGEAASGASLNGLINNTRANEYKITLKRPVNSHVIPGRMLTVGKILRHFGFQVDQQSIRTTASPAGGVSEIYFTMSIA